LLRRVYRGQRERADRLVWQMGVMELMGQVLKRPEHGKKRRVRKTREKKALTGMEGGSHHVVLGGGTS